MSRDSSEFEGASAAAETATLNDVDEECSTLMALPTALTFDGGTASRPFVVMTDLWLAMVPLSPLPPIDDHLDPRPPPERMCYYFP